MIPTEHPRVRFATQDVLGRAPRRAALLVACLLTLARPASALDDVGKVGVALLSVAATIGVLIAPLFLF